MNIEVLKDREWYQWLLDRRANSTMRVKLKGLDQLSSQWLSDVLALFGIAWTILKGLLLGLFRWSSEAKDGEKIDQEWSLQRDASTGLVVFQRNGGGFHQGAGLEVFTDSREVAAWSQLILIELGGGGYVLMVGDKNMERFILAAREEPGNNADVKRHILLSAAVQMSIANANAVHGGARPNRWELIEGAVVEEQPQDGGRYLDKVNQLGFVAKDLDSIELLPNERIFTRQEMSEALRAGECNSHLAEVCGHLFT